MLFFPSPYFCNVLFFKDFSLYICVKILAKPIVSELSSTLEGYLCKCHSLLNHVHR